MSLVGIFAAIFWFMILLAWVWMLISIFRDILSDHQLSGGAKALWSLFLIVAPWLGTLVYLVARSGSMHERAVAQSRRDQRWGQLR
jgi:Phospholipase_D-nuclease N-terminal